MHPLDPARSSAQRKLARGIEQIQTFRGEAKTFEDSKAYVFRTERETRSPHEVAYRCFASERDPPPFHWPLLVGEALQNLRSALDHAVAACTTKRNRMKTQFPIFADACEFQVVGLKMLPGVPPAIRAAIEETQPYRRLPQAPSLDVLELLRSFSNIDKHRTLATVACAVAFESAYSAEDVRVHWEKAASGRELSYGEAEVSVIVATSARDISDMEMSPHLSYQVRIEGRPLDFFPPTVRRVFEAVSICENGGQPAPFAAYPL